MTEKEVIALLMGIPSVVAAIASVTAAMISRRNGKKTSAIQVSINGRLEQLLQQTARASLAEGKLAAHQDGVRGGA